MRWKSNKLKQNIDVAHIQFKHTKQIRDDKAPVYITLPTDYKIKGLVKFVFVFAC